MRTKGEFIHNDLPSIIYILVIALLMVISTKQKEKL